MGKRLSSGLTPRQREWLRHLRKAESAGEAVRAYAQRHGLSEHSMYQAAKDLRRKGVRVPGRSSTKRIARRSPGAQRPRFVEVKASPPAPTQTAGAWRARLPNGVVIEGAGEPVSVLEALARL